MTMQNNIDMVRWNIRRNVHEPELQAFTGEIDNQWPVRVPVAVAPDNGQWGTDNSQIIRDRRFADIAQMPNLVRLVGKIDNLWRQFVVSVSDNEDFHRARKSPSTKPQIPGKLQYPKLKCLVRQDPFRILEPEAWEFLRS